MIFDAVVSPFLLLPLGEGGGSLLRLHRWREERDKGPAGIGVREALIWGDERRR